MKVLEHSVLAHAVAAGHGEVILALNAKVIGVVELLRPRRLVKGNALSEFHAGLLRYVGHLWLPEPNTRVLRSIHGGVGVLNQVLKALLIFTLHEVVVVWPPLLSRW